MNRRAAAQRRSQAGGYTAPADRPRQRRSGELAGTRAAARALLHGVEVREDTPAGGAASLAFRGYASVTENAYDMWDMFGPYTETIAATAFDATLAASPDVAFLLNHGGMTLARTTSGTLRLSVDEVGLLVDADLDPDNGTVREIASGLRRGDLDEMSFAFRIERGTWDPSYTAYRIEQLNLDRGDVSVVNYGANPDTYMLTGGPAGSDDPEPEGEPVVPDVDALDDEQALALTVALDRRGQRRARNTAPGGMSRAELDELAALAAPHPLTTVRVRD